MQSSEGKISYRETFSDQELSCTCGDFTRAIKSDPKFRCKHILAVIRCNVKDIKNREILEKKTPKIDPRFIKIVKGQDLVTYRGILDLAHQKGLIKITVEVLQIPTK